MGRDAKEFRTLFGNKTLIHFDFFSFFFLTLKMCECVYIAFYFYDSLLSLLYDDENLS